MSVFGWSRVWLVLNIVALLGCTSGTPAPTKLAQAPTTAPFDRVAIRKETPNGPTTLLEGVSARMVTEVGASNLRLVYDKSANELLMLGPGNEIWAVSLTEAHPNKEKRVTSRELNLFKGEQVSGMRMAADGNLYVVYNTKPTPETTQAGVIRGTMTATGKRDWKLAVRTEPYPASNTNFDHLYNGLTFSPDGKWMYLNAGSRTDHGEIESTKGVYPGLREVPLTTKVLRVPANADGLVLSNDDAQLRAGGYVFVDGTRNAYDMAFAPNGDLIAGDNGPDSDYPDEINWLREGRHYGFPWRFGAFDNPQQLPAYDPATDKRLSQDFVAVKGKTYVNDPTYPKAPTAFTDPILNRGPAGAWYKADDGSNKNAGKEEKPLAGITPHRSPLGLSFAFDPSFPADLRGTNDDPTLLFVSWGAAGSDIPDKGFDLLMMRMHKTVDNYEARTIQVAKDFKNPIDTVLVKNKLYVLEFGNGAIWEITFD